MIDEGQMIVRACLRRNQPGPYQIQSGICCALGVHPSSVYGRDYDVQEAS
jgi:RNA polymerase sigma-70 factor (ECF subfamily)